MFVVTPVSIPVCKDRFCCQGKGGGRERERQQVFVVTPDVYSTLYGSFPVSKRERGGGGRERVRRKAVYVVTPVSMPLCMNHFQYEREMSVLQSFEVTLVSMLYL